MAALAEASVVIIQRHINVSNQHIAHLNPTQYVSTTFHLKKDVWFFMVERQGCLQSDYINFLGVGIRKSN